MEIFIDLGIPALGLIAIAIGLSAWEKLGLEWHLTLAASRTIIQLLGVGYILALVFALNNPWAVLAILGLMLTVATIVSRNRISKKIPRLLPLVAGSLLISTILTLSYTTLFIIKPEIWYKPEYIIPFGGIVLGNAMNSAALAGERLVSTIRASQLEIETHLSLGATPEESIAQYRKDAIKAALIPTLNQMMVIGIVTLPGTITGQLLGNINPIQAAAYQMIIMFMVAFASIITTILLTKGIYRQFFTAESQLIRY